MAEFMCAGYGGQGILVAGLIIAYAGMKQGNNVTWFPSYGAEMRGGTANCHIKVKDSEIASPYVSKLDVLIALNEASLDKLEKKVRPGGWILYNSSLVNKDRKFRDDVNIACVDATNIAQDMGNARGTNLIMLGALTKINDTFTTEFLRGEVDSYFESKGKHNPKNAPCFDKGAEELQIIRKL